MTTINISNKVKKLLDGYKAEFQSNTYSDTLLILILEYKRLETESEFHTLGLKDRLKTTDKKRDLKM